MLLYCFCITHSLPSVDLFHPSCPEFGIDPPCKLMRPSHPNTCRDPVDIEEDDEGEELIGDQMEEDYRVIPELDVYDPAMLADENEEIDELDAVRSFLCTVPLLPVDTLHKRSEQ